MLVRGVEVAARQRPTPRAAARSPDVRGARDLPSPGASHLGWPGGGDGGGRGRECFLAPRDAASGFKLHVCPRPAALQGGMPAAALGLAGELLISPCAALRTRPPCCSEPGLALPRPRPPPSPSPSPPPSPLPPQAHHAAARLACSAGACPSARAPCRGRLLCVRSRRSGRSCRRQDDQAHRRRQGGRGAPRVCVPSPLPACLFLPPSQSTAG